MEEVTSQEAAESPRGHFQPLENQSECLSPELRFLQDTDMEQGFSGGVCDIRGCGCASYTRGVGMPGPCSEGALQRSDVRELWKRGLTGHTSPPSHHPDSLCEFLPSPESYPGKCFLWRNTCSPYGRNHQEMAQGSAFHRECSSQHGNSFSKIVRYHTWLMEHMFLGMPPLCKVPAPSLSDIW